MSSLHQKTDTTSGVSVQMGQEVRRLAEKNTRLIEENETLLQRSGGASALSEAQVAAASGQPGLPWGVHGICITVACALQCSLPGIEACCAPSFPGSFLAKAADMTEAAAKLSRSCVML